MKIKKNDKPFSKDTNIMDKISGGIRIDGKEYNVEHLGNNDLTDDKSFTIGIGNGTPKK